MNDPVLLFGFTSSLLEIASFLLAVLTVVLNIRQNHWAWFFSITSSALYASVFYQSRLYGDMGLQFVFIAVSVWGWMQWLGDARAGMNDFEQPALTVRRLSRRGWLLALAGWAAGYVVLSFFLKTYTDTDVPHADGFLTAGSLLGQLLLSRKNLENWHVWIVVDILYIGLYAYKNLMLTAVLYGLFVCLAVIGLLAWQKSAPAMRLKNA